MKTYYIYEFEGEQTTVNCDSYEAWPFFREVAAIFAMSDLSEQTIIKIVYNGKEYHYAGWAPGMEYTFINDADREDSYTTWMEHLEH